MKHNADFASLVEAFFTDRLMDQRQASPHTIASYRDTFRLLLDFVQRRRGKAPSELSIRDMDAPLVIEFLGHLEKARGNTARTRNLRLSTSSAFWPSPASGMRGFRSPI
jgi:site-specific recombinase XerC